MTGDETKTHNTKHVPSCNHYKPMIVVFDIYCIAIESQPSSVAAYLQCLCPLIITSSLLSQDRFENRALLQLNAAMSHTLDFFLIATIV